MSTRICKNCEVEKNITKFNIYRVYKGEPKYRGVCTTCYNRQARKRVLTNEQKAQHAEREKDRRHRNPERLMLSNAKARAKRKGLEFCITLEDINIPTHCPVLGIELERGGCFQGSSPSLDRIDNTKGYIPGNVIVVSYRANTLKNDASLHEMQALVTYYSKLLTE
jgi:hypothetical protein